MEKQPDVSYVWIVDDDKNFCQFLQNTLEQQPSYKVLGTSNSLYEAKRDLFTHTVDLITVDLSLPDGSGVELIAWLQFQMPKAKKIIVSFWDKDDLVFDAFRQGADGYLQKDQLLTMEIHNAIYAIEQGGTPISPKIAKKFLQFFAQSLNQKNAESTKISTDQLLEDTVNLKDYELSEREIEVLQLLTKGYNYKEISRLLNISFNTVCTHIKHVYRKIKVTSKTEALIEAQKNHWFNN